MRIKISFQSIILLIFTITISSAFVVPGVSSSSLTSFASMTVMKKNKLKGEGTISFIGGTNVRGGDTTTKLYVSGLGFTDGPFLQSTKLFTIANGLGWIISLLTGSHVHLDLIGTGAFALVGLPAVFEQVNTIDRTRLSGSLMTLWGAKLAGFLFFRALKTGHDARLESTLSTVSGTTVFWVASLVWGVLCSLPHTLGTTSVAPGTALTTKLGTVLYIIGIAFETIADVQKWKFKQANPSQFCNQGVWALSQHPNYFGNLLLWSGIYLINAPALIESVPEGSSLLQRIWGARKFFFSLLSPLFLFTLFSGQANGSITSTVEMANAKYGSDPQYQKYITETPLIFPNPLKWFGGGGSK